MNDNPFTRALGPEIESLPPCIRDHFDMPAGTRHYQGTMTKIWRRPGIRGQLAKPVLKIAALAKMLFSETGSDVGFSLRHRVTQTPDGPVMVWAREFRFPGVTRRFDAVMRYSEERRCLVDWLGGNGELEAELHPRLIDNGIAIESGKQWLRLGRANLPLPGWIAGKATVREWADDEGVQRIRVVVSNPLLGDFFGYEGSFSLASTGADETPDLNLPPPAVPVPVARWTLLTLVAFGGTALVAGSFAWAGSTVFSDVGTAIGVGSGVAWVGFGLALLTTAKKIPAVTWADICLRCMAVGMAILSTIFAINSLRALDLFSAQVPGAVYTAIVLTADVAMATCFVRHARRHGVSPTHSIALWVLVLNGLCAAVVAAWLTVF